MKWNFKINYEIKFNCDCTINLTVQFETKGSEQDERDLELYISF